MKFILTFLTGILLSTTMLAQTPLETARSFMNVGDWDNAIVVLTSAIKQDPDNQELKKYLVLSYTYDKNFSKALEVVEPMLDNSEVDVQTYQAAGNVYRALAMYKDGSKMFKKALKKFPKSGPLYNEYGEMLWDDQDYEAIEWWEKGIAADPSYAGNYYNAASYYYFIKDKVWTLIYGEIFVNMENLTERSTEMKRMLLSTYKEKLYTELDEKSDKNKNEFSKAVFEIYQKQSPLVSKGINIETLSMIRTRFILDWYNTYAQKFPFRLFDYHQQLIREGMFEAYNNWLFGPVANLSAFDQWSKTNAEAYAKFTDFQKGRVFKMPQGQYYK